MQQQGIENVTSAGTILTKYDKNDNNEDDLLGSPSSDSELETGSPGAQ